MKKILSLILTFLIILTFAGCGNKQASTKTDSDTNAKDYVYTDVKGEYIVLSLYKGTDKNVVIPGKIDGLPVKTIGSSCFAATEIESVEIPDSVTEIFDSAFLRCKNLKKVTLSENLTAIAAKVFEGCSALTDIEIPEKVAVIDSYAFFECSSLKKLTIPEGVTNVGTYAFLNSGITELKFLGDAPTAFGDSIIGKGDDIAIYHPADAHGWDNEKFDAYTLKAY